MEHARVTDGLDAAAPHAHFLGDHGRAAGDPFAVAAGVEVFGLHRLAQCGHSGGVGTFLRGELAHCPPRYEQRDQDEDRREGAGPAAPQCRDEQAKGRIAEIGEEQQRDMQSGRAARLSGLHRRDEHQHSQQQPVVKEHVHDRRDRERNDDGREGIMPGQPDGTAECQVSAARAIAAEPVHGGAEYPPGEVDAAAHAEQRGRAHRHRAERPEQHHGGERRGCAGRPGRLPGGKAGGGRVTDQEQQREHYKSEPGPDPGAVGLGVQSQRLHQHDHSARHDDGHVQPGSQREPGWRLAVQPVSVTGHHAGRVTPR